MKGKFAGVKSVVITDVSEYDSSKCNDGGCYSFSTIYTKVDDNHWSVTHETSADMEYCPICGSFGNHWDDDAEEYRCGKPDIIRTFELLNRIADASENDDFEISYIGG